MLGACYIVRLESQDFRDHIKTFLKFDTLILGISRDTLKLHEKENRTTIAFCLVKR